MRKAERLFQIVQILRRGSRPVTACAIAAELEVTARTVYRDVAHLQARGVPIAGAAGLGYVMGKGFDLPPLMFTEDEIEALVLGARIVESWADPELGRAARDVVAKIAAVLPEPLRPRVRTLALVAPPSGRQPPAAVDTAVLRRAVREQSKLELGYVDLEERRTRRIVWPMAMAFYPPVWLLVTWCELRQDFRTFRVDRILTMEAEGSRYPQVPGRRLVDYLKRQAASS